MSHRESNKKFNIVTNIIKQINNTQADGAKKNHKKLHAFMKRLKSEA